MNIATRLSSALGAALLSLLAACSGGSGDGSASQSPGPLPESVTRSVSAAEGGQLRMVWADGAVVTIGVRAGSFDADRNVTLSALAPEPGAPLRFALSPSLDSFARPLTLRVKPAAGTDAGMALALRWRDGDWIATRVLPDGSREATIVGSRSVTTASLGARKQAQRATAADSDLVPPSQFSLSPFMMVCEKPADAVAAARAIFDRDPNSDHITSALAIVANLSNTCGQHPSASDVIEQLRATVREEYPRALGVWKAMDYRDLSRMADFRSGLMRVLAWCGAAQHLGITTFECPNDTEAEFEEVLAGSAQALESATELGALQRHASTLVSLSSAAAHLGVGGSVDDALLAMAGQTGRRIVERAWALCSMPDLAHWAGASATLPNAHPQDLIEEAYLFCGTRVAVQVRDAAGKSGVGGELQPGDFEGRDSVGSSTFQVAPDGHIAMRFTGPAMRCSRVIGAAQGRDQIVWRVGTVELGRRQHDGTRFDGPDVELALPALRAKLGQALDSRAPIYVEIWRVDTAIDCDFDGAVIHIAPPDSRIYTVVIWPPTLAVQVSTFAHTLLPGARQTYSAKVLGLDDQTVDWSADGGAIGPDGVYVAPDMPGRYTVTATSRSEPTAVGTAQVTVIQPLPIARNKLSVAGSHACALDSRGGVWCWGVLTTGRSRVPSPVPGLSKGVAAVHAGPGGTCALLEQGTVQCWGARYVTGSAEPQVAPVELAALGAKVVTMAVGDSHACAVTESGGVKCWGSNSPQGLLGNASTTAYRALAPVDVLGLNGPAVAVSVGSEHSCALLASGTVQCWGSNWWGQLGIGSTLPFSSRPLEIASNERRFVALSAQVGRSCAIDEQGGAWCWGDSWLRRLGVSTGSMTPARVVGLASGVSQLAAGGVHTCAVTASGPRCWGSNANGGLGNGSLDDLDLHTPVAVVGLPAAAVAIGVGNFFSCAALDSGAIYCWGRNDYGELGDGLDVDYSITPVRVLGFP